MSLQPILYLGDHGGLAGRGLALGLQVRAHYQRGLSLHLHPKLNVHRRDVSIQLQRTIPVGVGELQLHRSIRFRRSGHIVGHGEAAWAERRDRIDLEVVVHDLADIRQREHTNQVNATLRRRRACRLQLLAFRPIACKRHVGSDSEALALLERKRTDQLHTAVRL